MVDLNVLTGQNRECRYSTGQKGILPGRKKG